MMKLLHEYVKKFLKIPALIFNLKWNFINFKHEGYWDFFDAGNWKSQNICFFPGGDWKFKHYYWKNCNPIVSSSFSNVSFSYYVKFIPYPVDFNCSVNQRMATLFFYIVGINILHKCVWTVRYQLRRKKLNSAELSVLCRWLWQIHHITINFNYTAVVILGLLELVLNENCNYF